MNNLKKSLVIREFLWNSGNIDDIFDAIYHFDGEEVNEDEYMPMIFLLIDYVPKKLLKEFDNLGDNREKHIDEYEEKIIKIINKKVAEILKNEVYL